MENQIDAYLSGEQLYGDDFNFSQIALWYKEEEEAYADLGSKEEGSYSYLYHNMNIKYGFKYLPKGMKYNHLGIGSAYGHEILPIIEQIKQSTIIEPSDNLRSEKIGNVVPNYVKPNIDGSINMPDETFDLITCFGTLHHIPNVSFVLGELIRVLKPNGYLLLREPIRTLGDWRQPRKGLTKNERGIPVSFFDRAFYKNNIEVIKKSFCNALFFYKIANKLINMTYYSPLHARFDKTISKLLSWNIHYHPKNNFQKMGPGAVFYVVRKKSA